VAAARAFGDEDILSNPGLYPYGIYTIPEISFIGKTEEQLTEEDVPYEVGVAYYREIARGQIRGDTTGRLKLIFHRMTHAVEVERLQLGRVNDVPDRYLGGGPSKDVAAASTTRAGDDSCAPQAQQDLLDVVVGEALVLGQFTGGDGTLSHALS